MTVFLEPTLPLMSLTVSYAPLPVSHVQMEVLTIVFHAPKMRIYREQVPMYVSVMKGFFLILTLYSVLHVCLFVNRAPMNSSASLASPMPS